MSVKLAQSRNEDSGIAATVGMMPPHELTAAHVLVVIHPYVTFPGSSAPSAQPHDLPASRTHGRCQEHTPVAEPCRLRGIQQAR